jgi:hypothetical protein
MHLESRNISSQTMMHLHVGIRGPRFSILHPFFLRLAPHTDSIVSGISLLDYSNVVSPSRAQRFPVAGVLQSITIQWRLRFVVSPCLRQAIGTTLLWATTTREPSFWSDTFNNNARKLKCYPNPSVHPSELVVFVAHVSTELNAFKGCGSVNRNA